MVCPTPPKNAKKQAITYPHSYPVTPGCFLWLRFVITRGRLHYYSPPLAAAEFSTPPSPRQGSHWTFWTPICRPPLAQAAVKLYHSSLLSPNSASHSNHIGLPNLLPLELLVFPASLAKLACRLKTQCTGKQGQLRTLEWFCAPGCDGYTGGLGEVRAITIISHSFFCVC